MQNSQVYFTYKKYIFMQKKRLNVAKLIL